MPYRPGVDFFGNFYSCDLSTTSLRCIFYIQFDRPDRRCRSPVPNKELAIRLRRKILSAAPDDVDPQDVRDYILSLCCQTGRYAQHRDNMRDHTPNVLEPLVQRWLADIQEPPAQNFRLHIPEPSNEDIVAYKIREQLGDNDDKMGTLYAYRRAVSPGYVKIGWCGSGKLVRDRLDEWEFQCGFPVEEVFSVANVPNAQRAETLIHHELIKEWRRERECKRPSCKKTHREWFEVSEAKATAVVGAWAEVLQQVISYGGNGQLNPECEQILEFLETEGGAITATRLLARRCGQLHIATEKSTTTLRRSTRSSTLSQSETTEVVSGPNGVISKQNLRTEASQVVSGPTGVISKSVLVATAESPIEVKPEISTLPEKRAEPATLCPPTDDSVAILQKKILELVKDMTLVEKMSTIQLIAATSAIQSL